MADQFVREKKSGIESFELWHSRIKKTLAWRQQHWNGDKAWRRQYRLFRGDHWRVMLSDQDDPASDAVRDRITVNVTGATVLSFLPFLVRRRPTFLVTARRPSFLVAAALQKEILNYEWRERKMQKQIKRAVTDAVICGHGIVKTGFVLEINDDAANNPNLDGVLRYEDYITKEAPYIKRVSPFMFLIDPEAAEYDLESARWCAEIFFKPLGDVLANKNYNKSVLSMIRSGAETPETVSSYMSETGDKSKMSLSNEIPVSDADRVVLYEIWDKKHMKYYVFAAGVTSPLIERDWPYEYLRNSSGTPTFPYVMVPFIPVPDQLYPLGLPRWIEDQQFELNRIRTSMFEHRRRFNRKYQALRGGVDDIEATKLEEGADGTVVFVNTPDAIKAIDEARLQSDQHDTEAVIKQDIREITGADELLRGGSLPSRTTATEVQSRASLISLKLDDRIESIDDFVKEICFQLISHIKANYVTEKVIKLAGPQGEFWVSFTQEDIQGDFDIDIETVSAEKTDPTVERQQALQIFQLVLQNLEVLTQSGVQVNVAQLFKLVMDRMGIKDVVRVLPSLAIQPGPVQEVAEQQAGNEISTTIPASQVLPGNLANAPGQVTAGNIGQLLGGAAGNTGTNV